MTANPQGEAITSLLDSSVVAILRGNSATRTAVRANTLVEYGCTTLEVTKDSKSFRAVFSEVVKKVGDRAVLGVGSCYTAEDVEEVASLGGKYALSPVNPPGFIEACRKLGIVSIVGCCTPTEAYKAHIEGADFIKLFPAQLWSPAVLKGLTSIKKFKGMKFLVTGGITNETSKEWFACGASVIGAGGSLCGDLSIPLNNDDNVSKLKPEDYSGDLHSFQGEALKAYLKKLRK
mmetsp:Transcript_9046/g.10849  ORF Transcript_9046/g.10849 Transcript_9046/m.10849 type:complete len:233 (-) Transcript_9046:1672-2370(-)